MANILQEAQKVVFERQGTYDAPENNFDRIAQLWTTYFSIKDEPDVTFTAQDVAMMMIMVKIAREVFQHKTDNLIDLCGYAQCLEGLHEDTV